MSTAAPSTPSHDEHDHLDDGVDTPMHVRVKSAELEDEVLIKQLLGLDLHSEDNPQAISRQVAQRVFSGVKSTRHGLERANFQKVFEARIAKAFQHIEHGHVHDSESEHLRKVKAVAEAVRNILPSEMVSEMLLENDSVPYIASENLEEGQFEMTELLPSIHAMNPTTFRVNLTHPFWSTKEFKSTKEMMNELDGRAIADVGITIQGFPPNKKLSIDDASWIATAPSTAIKVIPQGRNYGVFNDTIQTATPQRINTTIKINKTILLQKFFDGRAQKPLGNFTQPELEKLLSENESVWGKLINTGKSTFKASDTFGGLKLSHQAALKLFETTYSAVIPLGPPPPPLQPATYNGAEISGNHQLQRDGVRIRFDANRLVRGTMTDTVGAEKLIGTLNQTELSDLLERQENWDKFISTDGAAIRPVDLTASGVKFAQAVALEIFKLVQATSSPSATVPLSSETKSLVELQKEFQASHKNRFNFLEGSQNVAGGAIAASLLSKNPVLASAIKSDSSDKLKAKYEQFVAKSEILTNLNKLKELPVVKLSGRADVLEKEDKDLQDDYDALPGVAGCTWKSKVAKRYAPAGGPIDPRHIEKVTDGITDKREAIRKELEYCITIKKTLEAVRHFLLQAAKLHVGLKSSTLEDYFVGTPLKIDQIGDDFNSQIVVSNILSELRDTGLEEKEEVESKLKESKEKLKDHKEATISGDQRQFLIIKEYFKKYKYMNDKDAELATKHVLASTQISRDVASAAEEVADELFGPAVDFETKAWNVVTNAKNLSISPERRSATIVRHVAEAFSIPTTRSSRNFLERTAGRSGLLREKVDVHWEHAAYPNLISAYYAMKRLYEGKGPSGIALQQTAYVQEQMKQISKILIQRHASRVLNDIGPAVHDKEWKAPVSHAEQIAVVKALMAGEPPEHMKHRIDQAIERVDFRTDFWRKNVLMGPKYGLLRGSNNKISAKNLLYGNKWGSYAGILYRAPKAGIGYAANKTIAATNMVADKAPSIAGYALVGTLLAGPLGAGIGAAIGLIRKKSGGGAAAPAH